MLSIGFELISRSTLKSVHKHVNRPENFAALVEKVHSYGIMVFGLFMFGFDGDDTSVFDETVRFNRDADYDACAYSVLTPYPGTLTWYELKKANRIVSYDWVKYDQSHVVYRPAQMSGEELRLGQARAYENFYSVPSIASRFPIGGRRRRGQWLIYNTVHAEGLEDRAHRFHCGADCGPGDGADAPDTADQARVAGRCARGCARHRASAARGYARAGFLAPAALIDSPVKSPKRATGRRVSAASFYNHNAC